MNTFWKMFENASVDRECFEMKALFSNISGLMQSQLQYFGYDWSDTVVTLTTIFKRTQDYQ